MIASRLVRIELTTAALDRATRFYVEALGFEMAERGRVEARVPGADAVEQVVLRRGTQTIALQRFDPAGAPIPADAMACDQAFQHFALPVEDIARAMARLAPFAPVAISQGGPQHLPQRSGGVTAYKFRDPDGHPLELIEFPDRRGGGIDHSAIVVTDVERSIAFYRDTLGLRLAARQHNAGAEQDRLDGLAHASVEVVALEPATATPHVELLGYKAPPVRPTGRWRAADVWATRLVFAVDGIDEQRLIADPDHHLLLLQPG